MLYLVGGVDTIIVIVVAKDRASSLTLFIHSASCVLVIDTYCNSSREKGMNGCKRTERLHDLLHGFT